MGTTAPDTPDRPRILIVEDDETIADLVSFKFASSGYETTIAVDGGVAWNSLHEGKNLPNCILLDLVMPGVDGFQLLEWLRNDDRFNDVPIVILTGRESDEAVKGAFERGANDYVTKPFSPTALVARIDRLLQ